MQEVTIVTKVDNQQAINAQVGLRKEIKNLKLELERLDEGTEEYRSTFMKLSNAMKEQKDRMSALRNSSADLGDIIGNTTKLAAGIAGGFQAAQGAMALFGIESEELQKTLLKVQAFASITQGLAQLEELTKVIPNLKNNLSGLFISSSKEASNTANTVSAIANSFDAAGDAAVIFSNKVNTDALNKSLETSKTYVDDLTILMKRSNDVIKVTTENIGDNIAKIRTFEDDKGNLIKKQTELFNSSDKLISTTVEDFDNLNKTIIKTTINYDSLGEVIDRTKVKTDIEGEVIEDITEKLNENSKAVTLGKSKIIEWIVEHKKALLIGGGITLVIGGIIYAIYKLNSMYQSAIEKVKLFNNINTEANKSITKQVYNLDILANSFNKLTSVKDKTKFIKEYGDVIDDASGKTLTLKQKEDLLNSPEQISKVKAALFEKAKAQAIYNKIIELQGKVLDENAKLEDARAEQTKGSWFQKQASRFTSTNAEDLIRYNKQIKDLEKELLKVDPSIIFDTKKDGNKTVDNTIKYVTKTFDELNRLFITFKEQNSIVRRDWLASEELENEKRFENLKRTQATNYEELYKGTEDYLQVKFILTKFRAEEELEIANENAKKILDTQTQNLENNINAIKTNLEKGKGLNKKDREDQLKLIVDYEKEKQTLTDNYNTTLLNNNDKYNKSINDNENSTYNDRIKNAIDFYDSLIKEVDRNNNILINKMNEAYNKAKTEISNQQDISFWNTLFNINPTELDEQLSEITQRINIAKQNIIGGEDRVNILNKELEDLNTTAERKKEIEEEITNITKEQSDLRLEIAEAEAEKRKAINENMMAIVEGSLQSTSSVFQSVIDNNDASYEEAEKRYQQQLESGKITKDQYDKEILAAQQKQNEKNKKWQAGIAMIDGINGAVKALSGAMSLGPIAGPIVGGVQAAAIIASTVASIRKIYAQKVSDTGGSGGSVSSSSVADISAPLIYSANVTTQSQEEKLNQPIKVYVTESDITNVQNKVRVSESEATF